MLGLILAIVIGTSMDQAAETTPLPVTLDRAARIDLSLTRAERDDDGPWSEATFRYDVRLQKPTETGERRMIWRLIEVNGSPVTPETSPSPDIDMTVDEVLRPVRIENLDEVIAAARTAFAGDGSDAGGLEMLAALTPETAAALFTRDATLISLGQGTDLYLGEDHSYETEGTLPWVARPVAMTGVYRLDSLDVVAGRATVRWSQEIDPHDMSALIAGMVEGMIRASGEWKDDDAATLAKFNRQIGTTKLENSRNCEFGISIATGLAETVECLTVIEFSSEDEHRRRESRLTATQNLLP